MRSFVILRRSHINKLKQTEGSFGFLKSEFQPSKVGIHHRSKWSNFAWLETLGDAD